MVGWSRRSAESDARRRRFNAWWETLTEQERADWREQDRLQRKKEEPFLLTLVIVPVVLLLIFFCIATR